MGTENAMLAATLADGHTVIRPAAQEPEVDDLIDFLHKMGADVKRTSPDTIEVHGKRRLRGASHTVVPDRIETGTFLVAAAVTGGKITLENAPCEHVEALVELLGRVGVPVACGQRSIEIDATGLRPGDLRPCDIETAPYPGLATDLQPPGVRAADPGRAARPASTRRSSRTGSSGWPSCASSAPRSTSRTRTTPRSSGPRRLHGAEADDRRPARRRVADPRRPGGRRAPR